MRVGLGVSFSLVVLLSDLCLLSDFVPKSRHFIHLDVALDSFAQLVHATRVFFCIDCSRTCWAVGQGAWNVMLHVG